MIEPPSPADMGSVIRITHYGAAATALNALVFLLLRWETLGGRPIAAWFAATLVICLWAGVKSWRARDVKVERVSRRAARRLSLTSFLLALPWAVLAIGVLPRGNEYDQLFALIVCVGMFSGAAMMLQRTLTAMLTYVITVNAGIAVGCALADFSGAYALVVYGVISASCLGYSAFLAGRTARERDGMVARLSDANRDLEKANRTISSLAYIDMLTGLPNRKAFSEAIERDIEEARRTNQRYCVLMLDLDNFKNVNDSLGHHVGDELLTLTGRRISGRLDGKDTVARLGGDEFAVLAPMEDKREPERLAAALIEAVSRPADIGGRRVMPGTSVGIAILPDHAASASELLRNADAALRQAKEMGKGRVVAYDAALGLEMDKANFVAGELKKALEDGGLAVHYQPKFDLRTGAIHGVEALVRWSHPQLGQVPPDHFLRIAAEHGIMQRLTSFIYERVAQDIHALRHAAVDIGKVAVNIHPVDLMVPDHLIDTISSLAERYAVGPDDLILEITEGCFAGRGTEATSAILGEISRMGYELSLDDFGTGYAALTHLRTLPVSEIKIDKSFVGSMSSSKSARAIVSAIVAIAKGMELRAVAEGIETPEQLDVIRELGAGYAQGYLWSPAIPVDELAALACGQGTESGAELAAATSKLRLARRR
ncbi:putative bifunctional diguanylate cyclase/phosphodiesterase [Oricola thermophila]|uniref:EAL domain-containing protein n=1 Tax=Oricola thermophila TaxID=2742145 RepID=A0A6N1VI49_9HYPH|nr:EAL domain-containing protein [Oricola thermophila]QKV20434.1 EAL domain-containing protein [Oricola thermophila]